jgi:hypothetical protein
MCASLPFRPDERPGTVKLNDIIMFTDKRQAEKGKNQAAPALPPKTKGSALPIPLHDL